MKKNHKIILLILVVLVGWYIFRHGGLRQNTIGVQPAGVNLGLVTPANGGVWID